jgi:hypothetical protein
VSKSVLKARRIMTLPEIGPIDGRTLPALYYRHLAAQLVSDKGGQDRISRAQRELIRRAAGLGVLADQLEGKIVSGEPIDPGEYADIAGTQLRVLRALGLARVPRDVTRLGDILRPGPVRAAS